MRKWIIFNLCLIGVLIGVAPIRGQSQFQLCGKDQDPIINATFSPDGKALLLQYSNEKLWLRDAQATWHLAPVEVDPFMRADAAFMPDGSVLVATPGDLAVNLTNLVTGATRQLKGLAPNTQRIIITPDHRLVVAGAEDAIKVWDIQSGTLLRTLAGNIPGNYGLGGTVAMPIAPDSRTLVMTESNGLALWDLQTGRLLHTMAEPARFLGFTPDSKMMLTSDPDSKAIQLRDVQTGKLLQTFQDPPPNQFQAMMAVLSADGKTLLTGNGDSHALTLWDTLTGKPLHVLSRDTQISTAAFAPDGKTILTSNFDTSVTLWDAQTGALIHRRDNYETPILVIVYAPDSQTVLTGDANGVIFLWDAHTGESVRMLCAPVITPTP